MRSKSLITASLALAGALVAGSAQAGHVNWSIGISAPIGPGIGIGTVVSGGGGHWQPAPVGYGPPVYGVPYYGAGYYAPRYDAPRYYAPRYYVPPVVYAPPPVYVPRRLAYAPRYAPRGYAPVGVPPPGYWRRH